MTFNYCTKLPQKSHETMNISTGVGQREFGISTMHPKHHRRLFYSNQSGAPLIAF